MLKGRVSAVNISVAKGTVKQPVAVGRIGSMGLHGDAHAGPWHRQVSLLSRERIEELSAQTGQSFAPGDFAENITTSTVDLRQVAIRDRVRLGSAEVEITQIGKACHGSGCAVFRAVGRCVMPTEGLFGRVVTPGEVRPGDCVEIIQRPLRCRVVTLSDRASQGVYEDGSGPAVAAALEDHFGASRWHLAVERSVLPDVAERLREEVSEALAAGVDVIITTGGTGIGPRDITPETLRPFLEKEIPGIMDVIRSRYAPMIPQAALSRSLAGVSGSTLIYALPGSVRAVKEYMEEILKTLEHALMTLWDIDTHGHPTVTEDPAELVVNAGEDTPDASKRT